MQNSINPLFALAETRAALIAASHEAARQLELEPAPELDEILACYRDTEES